MRAHEVPTHLQAEDKVLLGFTFPQIVAMIAVCAISYGAYTILPFGTSEVRMGLAIVLGLVGIAVTVGKVGGRRLPLVAADLLGYGLGPRRYAGTPAQLVRSEPPPPIETPPGPLSLMVKRAKRGLRRQRRNKNKDRRNGRRPFRPHGWFGKRRNGKDTKRDTTQKITIRETGRRKSWRTALAIAALLMLTAAIPQMALADGHRWDEIDYEPREPAPGRRLFVEGLEVSGDRAEVTLRAATGLSLRVRAYGGWRGRQLRFWGAANLDEGEAIVYDLPLSGEKPVLHLLLGGLPGTGGGGDSQGRADTVPAAFDGGGALRPPGRLPGLDAGKHQGRCCLGLRVLRRRGDRPPDGGGAPQRHPEGGDGRVGDRHHRERLR